MSAIEAFTATWSAANATFGDGVSAQGAHVDRSAELHQLKNTVQSAAPSSAWAGSGSDTYAEANSKQARTFSDLADLDERLGTEVDRAAAVVTAGRRDLDTVRRWVNDAAARVPDTVTGERTLWQVVGRGSGEIADIITRSHGDLSAIAERIRGIGGEYHALGTSPHVEGVDMLDFKEDGTEKDPTPRTTLDLTRIKRYPPFVSGDPSTFGPPNSVEIGPGTYVPVMDYPGVEPPRPKAPLDYKDIEYLGPHSMGKAWQMELVPGSGAWVPDPNYPGYTPHTPEIPVDMAKAQTIVPNGPMPYGMMELYPGSSLVIPDPDADGPR